MRCTLSNWIQRNDAPHTVADLRNVDTLREAKGLAPLLVESKPVNFKRRAA